MNKIIITIIAISMLYPAENTVDVKKAYDKKGTIIDRIETTDADAQIEIDRLKKEYETQREQIHQKYDMKKQTLKKQRQQEMDNLREAYKSKVKRLQNKYPKKINRKSRKHVKPLDKKDSKYLDPRESNENMKIKDDKKKNKKLDSDQPAEIKTKKLRKPKKAQK